MEGKVREIEINKRN